MSRLLNFVVTVAFFVAPFSARASMDKEKLFKKITERCQQTRTDVVQIYQDGQLIFKYESPRHFKIMEVMSVTKSFMSLAIGFLLSDKKIESIDTPVSKYFPEWNDGMKKQITIRHILNHTSGIQSDEDSPEVGDAFDVVKLALSAPEADPPGTRFFYNSKAVNVLTGLVKKLSGMQPDEYLDMKLFKPLGIKNWFWLRDPSGNSFGNGGLEMDAESLSKVGLFILNDGVWNGQRLMSPEWIQKLFLPSQSFAQDYSLLWWLVGDPKRQPTAPAIAARGYLGQSLVVSPKNKLVAVRQIHRQSAADADDDVNFGDFGDLLLDL